MRFNSERMRPKEAKTIKSSLSEGSNKKQFEIRYNALSIALFLKGFPFHTEGFTLLYPAAHALGFGTVNPRFATSSLKSY